MRRPYQLWKYASFGTHLVHFSLALEKYRRRKSLYSFVMPTHHVKKMVSAITDDTLRQGGTCELMHTAIRKDETPMRVVVFDQDDLAVIPDGFLTTAITLKDISKLEIARARDAAPTKLLQSQWSIVIMVF